jgi:hypothetical protein
MKRLFQKRYSKKMLSGVEMVKLGVLDHLAERFKGIYGQETADSLAAAVVNELFANKPADPYAREFFITNKDVIERELANLQYDDQTCKIITQAIRIMASLSDEHESRMQDSLDAHVHKLTKLGIFLPDEYTPTPSFFLQMAHEFYQGK